MKNWSRTTRLLIGGFVFAILLTVGLIVFAVWKISNLLSQPLYSTIAKDVPSPIREPKILIGADFLNKTDFFKQTEDSIGKIVFDSYKESNEAKREIAKLNKIAKAVYGYADVKFNTQNDEIILLGKFGAQFLDKSGNLKKEIVLEPDVEKRKLLWMEFPEYKLDFNDFKIVDLEKDGQPEFLAYDGRGGLSLFNSQGKKLFNLNKSNVGLSELFDEKKWEEASKENPNVKVATAGDLDGDGISEIIYTTQNDEIIAVDQNAKRIWQQKSEVSGDQLWTFDLDGDSKNEIVELFFSKPELRDSDGSLLKKFEIDYHYNNDVFADGNKLYFFGISENNLKILDEEGKEVFAAEAPLSKIPKDSSAPEPTPIDLGGGKVVKMGDDNFERIYGEKSAWVKFKNDQPKYLAAFGSFILLDRAIFYVYSPDGKLIYHEILPEECRGITTLPNENGSEDILLLGKNTVWRYNSK